MSSQQLLTAMLDQETGARGFFQTGRPVFLAPWYRGSADYGAALADLHSMVGSDPSVQRMLTVQAQLAGSWHSATQAAITTLAHTGRSQSSASALKLKAVMDGFRRANADFDAALGQRRDHSLTTATYIAVVVVVAVALAGVLAGGGRAIPRSCGCV